ncbi:MAG TPA: outer membrane lipoprotein carrier protein LolA [Gemmatimonadales bacterium]|nr:outer membrane lipoprotein carrier protein LolA [Gemmatimonadales bacterium]
MKHRKARGCGARGGGAGLRSVSGTRGGWAGLRAVGVTLALLLAYPASQVPAQTAVPAQQPAQDAKAVVTRAANAYRGLNSLRAEFDQSIENPMIGNQESKGVLVQSGQAKLSMRFSDPPGEAIVIDGRSVWIYTPSTTPGQVLKLPVPTGGPVYGYNLIAWLLDRPAERYSSTVVRTDQVDGRPVDVVEMVPTVPDMPFSKATVWLDRGDALPRRIEVDEISGQKRTLTLHRLRTNVPVSDKTFTFEVPPGVRVVEQG